MKTKKLLSLALALIMALSLAVPAFAGAAPTPTNTVATGDVYMYDASDLTALSADGPLTILDKDVSITVSTDDTLEKQVAAWATANASAFTDWTVGVVADTAIITFTATKDNLALPEGVTVFKSYATVEKGDVYSFDAAGVTAAASGDTSLTVNGDSATIEDPDDSGNTTIAAQLAEWAAAVSVTGWDVSLDSDGTTVLYTATADGATVPGAAKVKETVSNRLQGLDALGTGGTTNIGTTTNVPVINVIIPRSGSAVLNPYKLNYNIDASNTSSNQIISAMQYVKSTSNVPLKVSISATATPNTGVTMSTKTIPTTTTAKQVYMYLNTASVANAAAAPTEAAAGFSTTFDKTKAVVLGTKAVTLSGLDLAAVTTAGSASYLAFRLEGDMTPAPTISWKAADKIDVALTFSFVASALTPATP